MGPLRFELRFLPPQGRRMAKLPHRPKNLGMHKHFHTKTYLCFLERLNIDVFMVSLIV